MPDDVKTEPPGQSAPSLPDWCGDAGLAGAEAWRRLVQGAADRRSAFHTMTVATVRDGAPTARTVVLRGVDPQRRVLWFHTDRRAPKLADMDLDPRVCLLLYDAAAKLQLRLDGRADILAIGETADRLWAATRPMGRVIYRQPVAPGLPLHSQSLDIPSVADGNEGRENFTVVEVRVHRLDLLYLHAGGHRRAVFDWQDGSAQARWIAP